AGVDMDLIAPAAQLLGRREPGGTGADDADRLRPLALRLGRRDPALGESRFGDEFFHRTDADRAKARLDDAIALAEPVLRTDAAADLGHRIGACRQLISLFEPPLGGHHQPVRDVVAKRAVNLAVGNAALRAPACLGLSIGSGVLAIDLPEVAAPLVRRALCRHGLAERRELQQRPHPLLLPTHSPARRRRAEFYCWTKR